MEVIAAVAHLYAAGTLLSAEDFSGGADAVAHQMRALGFTVEDAIDVADGEDQESAPQLVLQPRGARDRGPQHFVRSVRQGIPLADIKDALGSQADVLAALYPDGIARLWGSTPTTQVNNEKAKALRGRRVGDDVLFYAENHFIARARILHLFDSFPVARAVWGTDEGDASWEHIIVLGDVEEFPTRIPAAPVLRRLNVSAPLRSLTLRSADDYRRVARFLPECRQPAAVPLRRALPAASSPLTSRDLLERVGSLNTHRHPENNAPSRHQPLALLWAISRIAAGKPRLAPWSSFRAEVGPLMAAFGLPGSKVTPEYPFWHLRGSGLWEVHGVRPDAGPMPQVGLFNRVQPVAGLTHAAAELLRNPLARLEAVVKLCGTYLDGVDQRELLSRVGLAGYATADGLLDDGEDDSAQEAADAKRATGPTERRESTSSRLVRDPAIASRVKKLHGHACQVCGEKLYYKRKPYNQAAHIRGLGSPHHGPDELQNLLCLCPNHHLLFDGLEIYVDIDDTVRRTHGGEPVGHLHRDARHHIDEAYLQYHRTLCDLSRLTGK
ncbi:HNH endonuclease [Streptomyces sp. LaPpAH-108]|uniref:HNH endonuclease n=1 Tax=Streptomyces sp. LaPpAH-108 TaxID=1155714 RepID=UPI001F2C4271|nr:HNH endonuclease [Streptomyces sp. LaPpAH-108]